jgi:hypothetical protein
MVSTIFWDEIVAEVANMTPDEIERELKTIDMDLKRR